ncbi:MAG TPA: MerR family transcriptional regulator [Solirubrobacteraceae bacterium]|jgi:DNA-binding transcriptional MerR regulator|nr:MerR family transcriptional regulator [Solirubrobacteraceae bacterium]
MSVIRTNAAAALLGVSPNTLRSWETRFAYPTPRRTAGGHRQFDLAEIQALRQAYAETQDIASAISVARERGEGPSTPTRLCAAFAEFGEEKADRLMEESMAVRSVERTVETVLLPAIEAIAPTSPEYCFAWRYATGWLAAAQRVAPPSTRDEGVLVFDASRPMDMDCLYTQALELFLRRAGLRVLTLPVDLDSTRIGSALRALGPQAMVLAGRNSSLEAIGRLVYATRQSGGELQVFDYREALPDTGASTVSRLGPGPAEAVTMLRERLANVAHTYNGRPDDGSTQTPFDTATRGGCAPGFADARAGDTQALA